MIPRRPAFAAVLVATLAACSDSTLRLPTLPDDQRPRASVAATCVAPTAATIENQIRAVYGGGFRSSALAKFSAINKKVGQGQTGDAVAMMFTLLEWTLKKYHDDALIGGQSASTQNALATLIGSLYCYVGLDAPAVTAASLGPDAAVAVVYPTSTDTVISTGTGWAEVSIPAGAVPGNQPVLVAIERIPESPFAPNPLSGPLATSLNQYPLFYSFSVSPAVTFDVPVTVGVCLVGAVNLAVPPGSRLRLAHNIAPAGIEILPLATPPVMNCGSIETASAESSSRVQLARNSRFPGAVQFGLRRAVSWLLPKELHAAPFAGPVVLGTCCLGGSTRNFSPFAAVDTLGYVSAQSNTMQFASVGSPVGDPPRVKVTGDPAQGANPIAGVTVTFEIVTGSGTINGGSGPVVLTTDANGEAALISWVLGTGNNQVKATPSYVTGSGFTPSELLFDATTLIIANGILIDASRDGGGWWFPQPGPVFNPALPHQGKALADTLRNRGYVVDELPRGATITTGLLSSYPLVIRAGYYNLAPYSVSELAEYAAFQSANRSLWLISDHSMVGDALAAAIGVTVSGSISGTVGTFSPHQLMTGVTPMNYQAGGTLSGLSPVDTVLAWRDVAMTQPVMAKKTIYTSLLTFILGDLNLLETVPQPLVSHLLAFAYVRGVTVTPNGSAVPIGGTLQMTANVDKDPTALGTPSIAWYSTNAAVATVSATGLVTGVSTGTATIGVYATLTTGGVSSGAAGFAIVVVP